MSRADRQRWEESWSGKPALPGPPSAFVLEHLDLFPRGRVLDLASGDGRHARMLAERGHGVVAVDLARAALDRIGHDAPRVLRVQMDLDEPGFRAASADGILCSSFLERRLFDLAAVWLRPGGVLLADTFVIEQSELGHPKNPDHLLRPNELLERLLGSFRILRYRDGEVRRENGERSFRAGVVARRRSE